MEKTKTTLGIRVMIVAGTILLGLGIMANLGGWGDVDVIIGSMAFIIPGGLLLVFGIKKKKSSRQNSDTKNIPNVETNKEIVSNIDMQDMVTKEDSKEVQKAQVEDEEGVVYSFETNSGLKSGIIKFYDDRYQFTTKKGKTIGNLYSELKKVTVSMGCLNICNTDDVTEVFTIEKKLCSEVTEYLKLKIAECNGKTFESSIEENDNESNAGNVMRWIVLPIGLLIIDAWLYFTFMDFNDFHVWAPVLEIIMAIVFLIWAVIGIVSWNNTCPECNAWDALSEIDKQIINVRNITISKTVEEKVYKANGMYTHKIEPSQVIQRKVSVPGKEYTYDITLKCKKCGYITHKTTTEKVED